MNFESTTYLYSIAAQSNGWLDFFKDIFINCLGGAIGGLLLYTFYVNKQEKKKDEHSKKTACTNALLTTQTTLMFQMQELAGLKQTCYNILNVKIGPHTLEALFRESPGVSEKLQRFTQILPGMPFDEQGFFKAANYIITEPYRNHILKLPYEIFEMIKIKFAQPKKICVAKCTVYFQNISRCNRKYNEIITLVERFNSIRDRILLQESPLFKDNDFRNTTNFDNVLSVIAKSIDLAFELRERIKSAQREMTSIFDKSSEYINLIGLSESIQAQKDENGNIIFNEVKDES